MVTEITTNKKEFRIPLRDAEIWFYTDFLNAEDANFYFNTFKNQVHWQQEEIKLFGKKHLQPRLTALFGNNEKKYSYSNIKMQPQSFPQDLLEIKKKVEATAAMEFTTCLINYYRSGRDSIGWHADDEKELGKNPPIASISLGAIRMFHLKHKKLTDLRYKIALPSGSLLLMKGPTQHFWLHQIPKTSKSTGERINLTFRRL